MTNSNAVAHPALARASIGNQDWVRGALKTVSGDDYFVGNVELSPDHGNREVLVYSTAVRAGGAQQGKIVGALGVFFDWQDQGRAIVEKEAALPENAKERTKVMILDADLRVIASSDPSLRFQHFGLSHESLQRGSYYDAKGNIVAFARTLGYQEYDGLGWWGVIVQQTDSDLDLSGRLGL